jgi:hypothetical protein
VIARSGRLSIPLQVFGTLIPAMSGSISSFGPTKSEVPESITALYFEASIFLSPCETESS